MEKINNDSHGKETIEFTKNNRLNLILIMLGMTVCFSTLWRFPYQVATFGGVGFIVIYLAMLVLVVYPALTAEWGLGRFTSSGPESAYSSLHFPKAVSYGLFFIVFAIGSYFIVWVGWILEFVFRAFTDSSLVNSNTNSITYFTNNIVNQPAIQLIFSGLVLVLIAPVLFKGSKTIEKLSVVIVPIFFLFLISMTGFIFVQPGIAGAIVDFFTSFDAGQITPFTFVAALGQAFFSLCLGGTYMVLYSSYMKRTEKHDIPVNAGLTIIGNTIASLLSMVLIFGILIYSTVGLGNFTAYGPGLLFSAIPKAFQTLQVSLLVKQILLGLFFAMFFFSAFLPMIAILEVLVVFFTSKVKISRLKAYIVIAIVMIVAAIPSALSPLEGGFLYNMDIFVGAIGSVLGSIMALFAFGWVINKKDAISTVNLHSKLTLGNKWYFMTKYITPFVMLFVILYALSDVIIGIFALNSIPETNFILYPLITTVIPSFIVIIFIVVATVYLVDKKTSNKF